MQMRVWSPKGRESLSTLHPDLTASLNETIVVPLSYQFPDVIADFVPAASPACLLGVA